MGRLTNKLVSSTISQFASFEREDRRRDTRNIFSAIEQSQFAPAGAKRNTAMPPSNTSGQQAPTNINSNTPQTFDKVPDVDPTTGLHEQSNATALKTRAESDFTVSHGILRQSDPKRPLEVGTQKSKLPPEKVFSIQLGSELFRLSGASIASDGQL